MKLRKLNSAYEKWRLLGYYAIPGNAILHSYRSEKLKSYINSAFLMWNLLSLAQ
jgi:hypothetical protein